MATTCVFRIIIGNAVGVVEGPDSLDPSLPVVEQYMVKIGVLDRYAPLDRDDVRQVIARLKDFATKHIAGPDGSDA